MRPPDLRSSSVTLAALLALAGPAWSQPALDRSIVFDVMAGTAPGVGARAAAMGDAQVAVATDATAFYWNPAGLAFDRARGWHTPSIRYSSTDLPFFDLRDMLDVSHSEGDIGAGDFRLLQRYEGRTVRAGGSAMMAWREDNLVAGAYVQGVGAMRVEDIGQQRISLVGWGLDATCLGLAYGDNWRDDLAWGVQGGLLRGGFGRSWGQVQDQGGPSYPSTIGHVTDHANGFNINAGIMYRPNERVSIGLVGRNLNSPTLHFSRDAALSFRPSVHLGVAVFSDDGRTVGAADLHNALDSNDQGGVFCIGVEHQVSGDLALRAGLNGGDLRFGAGYRSGDWHLEFAAALDLAEELALSAWAEH